MLSVDAAGWYDELLPDSTLVIYEGIGHLPQEEHAEASIADLRSWLARTFSAAPSEQSD